MALFTGSKAGSYSFTVTHGTYWSQVFTMTGYDLSTYTATLTIRAHYDSTALVTLTKGSGITLANGSFTLVLTSAQLTTLKQGEYVYDLQVTDTGSKPYPLLTGTINVLPQTN